MKSGAENPYLVAHLRQEKARRRVLGWWTGFARWAIVGAVLVAFPFLADTVFRSLSSSPAAAAAHTADLVARLGLLLAAAMALNSYALLVRGPDRGVLDLHPLEAGAWYAARMRQLSIEQLPWLVASIVFLLPAGSRGVSVLAPALALASAWSAGLGVGVGVNLAAPSVALDPRFAVYLDALRGPNPRMQAALIWAPGVALGIAGTAWLLGVVGLEAALLGGGPASFLLLVPWVVGAAGFVAGRREAATVEKLPALLGEIDAAWAGVETPEEERAVAMDWTVRLVPKSLRRDLLREVRHLGRTLKIWQSAGYGLALAAAAAGWVPVVDGYGPLPSVTLAAAGVLGLAAVRLGATDPPWLEEFMDLDPRRILLARTIAVWLVLQPAILAGTATGLVRSGSWAALVGLRVELLGIVLAFIGAWAGARWRVRGWMAYVPVAALVWAIGGAM